MFVGYEGFSSCVCILFIRTAKYHMKGICGGTESKTGAKREIFIKKGEKVGSSKTFEFSNGTAHEFILPP